MTPLAKKIPLTQEALYTSLFRKGNPCLDTLAEILVAAELRLTITT